MTVLNSPLGYWCKTILQEGKRMNPITLEIRIDLQQQGLYNGRIGLQETIQIPHTDFMGMAAVMRKFHDIVEEIKKLQVKEKK